MPTDGALQDRSVAVKEAKDQLFDCELTTQQVRRSLDEAAAQLDASTDEASMKLWTWRLGAYEVLSAALADLCGALGDLITALRTGSDDEVMVRYDAVSRARERVKRSAAEADAAARAPLVPQHEGPSVGRALIALGLAGLAAVGITWAVSRRQHEDRTTRSPSR